MKTKYFLLAALSCLINLSSAMADGPMTLTASTGQNIRVWFATKNTSDGNTANSVAYGVHISFDGGVAGTSRVVLINNCSGINHWDGPSQTIYNCEYGNDGTWVNQQNCSVQIHGNANCTDRITVWWASHAGESNCYQQIAVSPTYNNWLVDPVSGQNNFNFRFPIPSLSR